LYSTLVSCYEVERNVKDYGAKGDGVTDDTSAIIRALTEERGSDPTAKYPYATYPSSTRRPGYVYFPAGTYKITQTLPIVYYTQMVGDADNLPTLKFVSSEAKDNYVIDSAGQWYPGHSQDNFYKQIRNFVIDMTECAKCTGIKWQVAQATSISNVFFKMGAGTQNQGLWMGDGSGGYLSDLVFDGGKFGMWVGNQQFTSRNITIRNASASGIYLNWDWVWTFVGLTISNCPIGIDVNGVPAWKPQGTGSLVVVDATFNNCSVGVRAHFDRKSPMNTIVLDNVNFNPAGAVVKNGDIVELKAGGLIKSWVQGRIWKGGDGKYDAQDLSGTKPDRPKKLTPGGTNFFQKPRPNYPASSLINVVKDLGFVIGSDVTKQLNDALRTYADKKALFFPTGTYLISDTVYVPAGSRMVGRVWSVLMATGPNFSDAKKPRPMLQVGKSGEKGAAQLSDFLISTQGPTPGAVLIEWNMADPADQAGACGMWDVHHRIGGADGTKIQPDNCPADDGTKSPPENCNGAWASMHITKTGALYMENVWMWTADHDIDKGAQLNVYNARGLLVESQGPVWMYGTASEHNYLYQYNFVNASNILMALIQTETPYYQPAEKTPFEATDSRDPTFCTSDPKLCRMSLAVHMRGSNNIYTYGTGLYSFFNTWAQNCQYSWPAPKCQIEMVKVVESKQIYTHALNTYGSQYMKTASEDYSKAESQSNTFCSTAAVDMNAF